MVRTLVLTALAASALSPGAVALAAAKQGGPAMITINDRVVASARIDLGRPGRSVGDLQITRALLYNKRVTQRPIGHSEMVCIATGSDSSSCTATVFLPKGKIVAIGPVRFSEIFEVAVVGGTGLYTSARGTLTITSLGSRPRHDLLVFRLLLQTAAPS